MGDFFNISDDDVNNVLNSPGKDTKKDDDVNYDIKEIGDRVTILDYSSVTHEFGEELDPDDYDNITDKDYYIVINKNKKGKYHSYTQDLLIVNPKTNKKFWIASKHVKPYLKIVTK